MENKKKNQEYSHKYFLNYTNFPNYFQLDEPNFVSLPSPNLFISDLVYTTRTDPLSRLNLNYKKLLKRVNIPNSLRMNLIYEKAETVLIPSLLYSLLKLEKLLKCVNTTNPLCITRIIPQLFIICYTPIAHSWFMPCYRH